MKTFARCVIYVMFMLSAVMLMVQPIMVWWDSGELNVVQLLVYCAAAFVLIFVGTESSEELKKRWRDDAGRAG